MAGEAIISALGLLEGAINRYLALDSTSLARMGALQGRVIGLDITGIGLRLYVLPGADGVQILHHYEGEPDALLRGTPAAFARLAVGDDASAVLFAGDVRIVGDTELGQRFKAVLDGMEVDWEEQLSRVMGDVAAHQLARGARGVGAWARSSAASLRQDVSEYLQEEARLVPTTLEVEEYLEQVDGVRSDADRLEARIARLEAGLEPPGGASA